MKEYETRERNDKTSSVIAIDLSAISVTVANIWEEVEEKKKNSVHLSAGWVHLRDCDNLLKGLYYILPAVVKMNFFINLWHAKSGEVFKCVEKKMWISGALDWSIYLLSKR